MNFYFSITYNVIYVSFISICLTTVFVLCFGKKEAKEPRSEVKLTKSISKSSQSPTSQKTRSPGSSIKKEKRNKKNKAHRGKKDKSILESKIEQVKQNDEDSLDLLKPRKQQAKRKEDIGSNLVKNKGEYKTWNVYMESSDFDESINDNKK